LTRLPKGLNGLSILKGNGYVSFYLAHFSDSLLARWVSDRHICGGELSTPFALLIVCVNFKPSKQLILKDRRYEWNIVALGLARVLACSATILRLSARVVYRITNVVVGRRSSS